MGSNEYDRETLAMLEGMIEMWRIGACSLSDALDNMRDLLAMRKPKNDSEL